MTTPYDALKLRLRSQPLIHGDETTVQVLKEKDREATSTSFMWAYRSGEDSSEPIVLLDYQPDRPLNQNPAQRMDFPREIRIRIFCVSHDMRTDHEA